MRKVLLSLLLLLLVTSKVTAVENLLIRLEQPKTPTNSQLFPITFVVLDMIGGRSITVTCDKQFEGGSTSQFYSTTVTPSGNTGTCPIDAGIVSEKGNYTITAHATADADTSSESVSFYYDNALPGDPRDYSKNKINSCSYEIKFKTADDSNKTSKVEIYRSTEKSFGADNGSRITEIGVGSNTEKSFTDTVPDCNKTYYYAVRAFSNAGNGSGIVGDREEINNGVSTTGSSPAPTSQQALRVSNGSVLGITESPAGKVLGVEEDATQSAIKAAVQTTTTDSQSLPAQSGIKWGTVIWGSLIGAFLLLMYRWLRK